MSLQGGLGGTIDKLWDLHDLLEGAKENHRVVTTAQVTPLLLQVMDERRERGQYRFMRPFFLLFLFLFLSFFFPPSLSLYFLCLWCLPLMSRLSFTRGSKRPEDRDTEEKKDKNMRKGKVKEEGQHMCFLVSILVQRAETIELDLCA